VETLEQIPWSPAPLFLPKPDLSSIRELRKQFGWVPPGMRYLNYCPWLLRANMELLYCPVHFISPHLSNLISLVVTQENACRYCYGSVRALMKLMGYTEDYIIKLENDVDNHDGLSPGEKLALDFSRRIARANPYPAPSELKALQQTGFSALATREIAFLAANRTCFGSRICTPLAVPPDSDLEEMAGKWFATIMRPLIKWNMSRITHRLVNSYQTHPEIYVERPFAQFVQTVQEIPIAALILRSAIDAAWDSPVISRRLKGMIFAIIGRALNCEPMVAESVRLLEQEGLTREHSSRALVDLTSERLDPFENKAIEMARETVRYRPDQIQKKLKAFSAGVSEVIILELLGTAALANMLSRMGILLQTE
jgi:alkylhydroperoxidase family enzyme